MLKNYLKIALRNFKRQKVFSFINIGGLATGIACCILILLWVRNELSYDRFHENAANIYRVTQDHKFEGHAATTYLPLGKNLAIDFTDIKSFVRIFPMKGLVKINSDKIFREDRLFYADSSFLKVFSFPLLKGNAENALQRPNTVVITESIAKKYFSNTNPIGKFITFDNLTIDYESPKQLLITGVLKDIPENSHLQFDFLVSLTTFSDLKDFEQYGWHYPLIYTYILLSPNSSSDKIAQKMPAFVTKHLSHTEQELRIFNLQPLTDIHLHSQLKYELSDNGNIAYVYIFSIVAIFIITIACINYMNLSTARSVKRAKEIGMRKVIGANRSQLIRQFFGESLLYTFCSYLLAVGLVVLILPIFNTFTGKQLTLNYLDYHLLLGLIAIVAFAGIVSGIYPALFLSSLQPIKILKGKSTISGGLIRKGLVILQFSISIALIIGTIVVYNQIHFIKNKKLGFEKEQILVMPIYGNEITKNLAVLENELIKHPDIKKFTAYSNTIGANELIYAYPIKAEGLPEDKQMEMSVLVVDYNTIETFGLQIVEGRAFSKDFTSEKNGIIINRAAQQLLNWNNPLGKKFAVQYINHGKHQEGEVIGVLENFHIRTLHHQIEPLVMFISQSEQSQYLYQYISMKVNSENISATLAYIESTWKSIESQKPFEYYFLDEKIDRQYKAEKQAGMIFSLFSLLAILIACLGLFGLASFIIESRSKEIGVRKVLGATIPSIILLLSKDFMKWVILANIIACPIAFMVMNKWLQNFAYRIDIEPWIFILSSVLTLMIAQITISYQSIKAAMTNPVEPLKYE